jgi:hypothetical protein
MTDNIIWIFLIFVFLIIIGLYTSEYTPLDLTEKQKALSSSLYENFSNNESNENFSPSISSDSSVAEGASRYYDWGVPDNNNYNLNKNTSHTCTNKCQPNCPLKYIQIPVPIPVQCQHTSSINTNQICSNCDITLNKDIDKYVLKSSVPPCPDMSEYVKKNMMNANPDLNDYILKSEIKPCEKVDLSNYILKSEIPPCPNCPVCPECPICPVCPPQQECKKIYQYDIVEHPDLQKYISREEVEKNYIKKSELASSPDVKNYLNQNCPKPPPTPSCPTCPTCPICPSTPSSLPSAHIRPKKQMISEEDNKNKTKTKKIQSEEYQSELLKNDVTGFYVGDSAFAGV